MNTIFSDENKITSSWIKFKEVGDRFEGTLVGKRTITNKIDGSPQIIYELIDSEKKTWLYGSKKAVDAQLRFVKLGQIIGLEFVEKRASSEIGRSPTHIIQVFANPKIVNSEWLEEKEMLDKLGGEIVEETSEKLPDFSADNSNEPFTSVNPKTTVLSEIKKIAKEKFGPSTDDELYNLIMDKTKIAFNESNYSQILEELKKI